MVLELGLSCIDRICIEVGVVGFWGAGAVRWGGVGHSWSFRRARRRG